jgi:hypothetical protein
MHVKVCFWYMLYIFFVWHCQTTSVLFQDCLAIKWSITIILRTINKVKNSLPDIVFYTSKNLVIVLKFFFYEINDYSVTVSPTGTILRSAILFINIILSCNWVFQWSWNTWVQLNTDLFRITSGFIYTMDWAGHCID